MDVVQAHGLFAGMWPRPELPVEAGIDGVDLWPAMATALSDLSGMLADVRDEEGLREALAHGSALVSAEVVPLRAVRRALAEVVETVCAWGDRQTGGEPCSAG